MALLGDEDRRFLTDHLAHSLDKPVRLLFFTQAIACQFCKETGQILEEVASLADKITLETYDFVADKPVAEEFGIDKIPATVVMSDVDHGIRFYGIPSGYEFTSLIEAIVSVSTGETGLSAESLEVLGRLTEPVHLQVFVTPTCPYCPSAVRMAHSAALASDQVRADMVESIEFPHLAGKYSVYGVPRTILNETVHLEGAVPEPLFMAKVQQAAGLLTEDEVQALFREAAAPTEAVEGPAEG